MTVKEIKIKGVKYSERFTKSEIAEQKLKIMQDDYITHAAVIRCKKTGIENLIAGNDEDGRKMIRHLINETTTRFFEDPETGHQDITVEKDYELVEQWKGDVLFKHEHEKTIEELVKEQLGIDLEEAKEKLKIKTKNNNKE